MANKIDTINVAGTPYEINLPTSATPSITSLTITGNLTVSSGVRFVDESNENASYYANIEYSSSENNLKIGFKETSRLGTPEENNYSWYLGVDRGGGGTTVDFDQADVEGIWNLSVDRLLTTSSLSTGSITPTADSTYDIGTSTTRFRRGYFDTINTTNLTRGSYDYFLPNKSGILATTDEIPNETMRLPILDYSNGRIISISTNSITKFPTITLSNGWDDIRLCGTVFIRVGTTNPDVILLGTISPFKAYTGQSINSSMWLYYPTVNTALNDNGSSLGQYDYKMWVRIYFTNSVPQKYEINVCRRPSSGGAWTQIIDDASIGKLYYHRWYTLSTKD